MAQAAFPAAPWHESEFFGNPVLVTHETHTRVGWEWIGFSRFTSITRKIG
jgi:YD repeat-containing protein